MIESATIILLSTENKFILQQRDDIPTIAQPGKITHFGGAVEEGESPIEAAARELNEELSITVNQKEITLLSSEEVFSSHFNENIREHLFVVKNIEKDVLILNEGEAIVYVKYDHTLDDLNFSERTKKIIRKYRNGEYDSLIKK